MLARLLDPGDPAEVREHLSRLTVARLVANSAYRFAAPFLASIAATLDVSLATVGLAVAVSELGGLLAPRIGHRADRLDRRRAMVGGLLVVAVAAALTGLAPAVAVLALGLVGISLAKIVFDVSLAGWVADRVPYERRARALGLTETSWAGAMLIGVPLMAVVAQIASWRWSYVAVALALVVVAVGLGQRLPGGHHDAQLAPPGPRPPLGDGWYAVGGLFALMGASQCVFVVYGAWLEDRFGIGALGLAGVSMVLGLGELGASLATSRFTDRWGKTRAVRRGSLVMGPAALVLAAGGNVMAVGLVALLVFVIGFEFAVVSAIPLGTGLVPGSPAAGLGLVIGAGTVGRAAMAVPATAGFEAAGVSLPAALAALLAAACALAMTAFRRRRPHT